MSTSKSSFIHLQPIPLKGYICHLPKRTSSSYRIVCNKPLGIRALVVGGSAAFSWLLVSGIALLTRLPLSISDVSRTSLEVTYHLRAVKSPFSASGTAGLDLSAARLVMLDLTAMTGEVQRFESTAKM